MSSRYTSYDIIIATRVISMNSSQAMQSGTAAGREVELIGLLATGAQRTTFGHARLITSNKLKTLPHVLG